MMCFRNLFKSILLIAVPLIVLSCNSENPATKPLASDTPATNSQITPKKLFYDSFPQPTGYVNDYESDFKASEKNTLSDMIKSFEKETTIQIAVVTFDSSMTTANGLEALTLRVANEWGIGRNKKNNGIVIGFSKYFKKIRIQNGKGIQVILSDAETKTIIDEDFLPFYKEGKYFEGTKKGLLSLMQKLREKYTA